MSPKAYSVVDRVIDLLEIIADVPESTLTDLVSASGLDAATVSRYLARLVDRGWLERNPETRKYRQGTALAAIGSVALSRRPIRAIAPTRMEQLRATYDETVHLAMRIADRLVVIDARESQQAIKGGAQIGEVDGWHNSSLGKAILARLDPDEAKRILSLRPLTRWTPNTIVTLRGLTAELDQTRERGYALDMEEGQADLRCVGVALLDEDRRPTYAISVAGPANRMPPERLAEIGRELRQIASDLSGVHVHGNQR